MDFFPGGGLWSSKVHDLLKPKSHLLIEPETDIYLPYLQPLLDQADSTYQLCDPEVYKHDDGKTSVSTTARFIQKWVPPPEYREDPHEKNDKILIITTATRVGLRGLPNKPTNYNKQLATNYLLWNYFRCLTSGEGVHSFGRVRLLAWMVQGERLEFNPRSSRGINPKTIAALSQCNVREVVSHAKMDLTAKIAKDATVGAKADPVLDIRSGMNISQKKNMEEHTN